MPNKNNKNKRPRTNKYAFEFDSKKNEFTEAYIFVRGEIPFDDLSKISSNSDSPEPKNFNSKAAKRTAMRSMIA